MLQIDQVGGTGSTSQARDQVTVEPLEPLVLTPPLPNCEVCVIIPIRDEAQTLAATLHALANQIDLNGKGLERDRYEIILLVNNCRDQSAAIARKFASQHPSLALHVVEITLPAPEAHVGKARRLLMDEAYRRLMLLRSRGIIVSTDGDTRVSPTWIAATLQAMAQGAEVVGGRILMDPRDRAALDPETRWAHLREVSYRHLMAELETYLDPNPSDPWPRHYQHWGGSLAVTAEIYERAGRLPVVRSLEDIAFYRALVRVDARIRHSPAVQVVTSGRQTGRSETGLASQLRVWREMGSQQQPCWVESAAAIETRFRSRQQLRQLWQRLRIKSQLSNGEPLNSLVLGSQPLEGDHSFQAEVSSLSAQLGVPKGWLLDQLAGSTYFGQLLEQVETCQQQAGTGVQNWPKVETQQAIHDLRLRLASLRQQGGHPLKTLKQVQPVVGFPAAFKMSQLSAPTLQE